MRHVLMRQGVLGVKVKIMLPYDPSVRFWRFISNRLVPSHVSTARSSPSAAAYPTPPPT